MNDNLFRQSEKVYQELNSLELVKEYKKYKKMVEESEEIKQLNNHLKFLKKCGMTKDERAEYNKLLEEYNDNIILKNYRTLEKEVEQLKEEIINILKL